MLEGSGCLCLSSNKVNITSTQQSSVQPLSSSVGSSSLASAGLVLGSGPFVSGQTKTATSDLTAIKTAGRQCVRQEHSDEEPSCLAPRYKRLKEEGFSDAVASRVSAPQR